MEFEPHMPPSVAQDETVIRPMGPLCGVGSKGRQDVVGGCAGEGDHDAAGVDQLAASSAWRWDAAFRWDDAEP
jgi:hypothetical protein